MSTEVFVSYSSQDYERVMPLVDRLRSAGVATWVDEGNIDAATLWSESIVESIAECRVLIMMVSSLSTDSHNVVKEVMIASESKKDHPSHLTRTGQHPSQAPVPAGRHPASKMVR